MRCCVPVKAVECGWGTVTEHVVLNDKRCLEKHPEKSHDSRKQVYRLGKKARGYWASQLRLGYIKDNLLRIEIWSVWPAS